MHESQAMNDKIMENASARPWHLANGYNGYIIMEGHTLLIVYAQI